MNWKQWTHGRQKDSYCLKISVTDAMDILERIQEGKKIPRKFQFNLGSIVKDFIEVNNKFKKDYGRSFNCNVDLNGNTVNHDQLEQATRSSKRQEDMNSEDLRLCRLLFGRNTGSSK